MPVQDMMMMPENVSAIQADFPSSQGNTITSLTHQAMIDASVVTDLRDSRMYISNKRLEMGERIGAGFFGDVIKAVYYDPRDQPIDVVIKKTRRMVFHNSMDVKSFVREALIMAPFDHKNILPLIGISFENGYTPLIVLPFMINRDLASFIKHDQKVANDSLTDPLISVRQLLRFCCDICCGMSVLSGQRVVHRDLAARNCVVDADMTIKIADFGLSRQLYQNPYYVLNTSNDGYERCEPLGMPVSWMSPESLPPFNRFSTHSDVWSFGVTMWEIFMRCQCAPWHHLSQPHFMLRQHLVNGHRLYQPTECPDSVYDIMIRTWNLEPQQRPDFEQLSLMLTAVTDTPVVAEHHLV